MSSAKTGEVAKNYKMLANPVFITPGRGIIIKTLDEQVLPRELHALLNSSTLWGSWECSLWNNAEFAFLKPL